MDFRSTKFKLSVLALIMLLVVLFVVLVGGSNESGAIASDINAGGDIGYFHESISIDRGSDTSAGTDNGAGSGSSTGSTGGGPAATGTPSPGASPSASGTPSPSVSPAASGTPSPSASPAATGTQVQTLTTVSTSGPRITWNLSVTGISSVQVRYTTEEIEVKSAKKLYYASLKKSTDTDVKPSDLIPASCSSVGDTYLIDFSTLSANKENFIGITTVTEPGTSGMIPVTNITVEPAVRKAVFNVDLSAESDSARATSVLNSVVITDADNKEVKYVRESSSTSGEKLITELNVQWRKGTNGSWMNAESLSSVRWDSMKNSGAVVYFRIGAEDSSTVTTSASGEGNIRGQRCSKESKIKLNVSKAPAVKLDVNKLALNIKNGMQFRIAGKTDWITVLPYDKKSAKTDSAIRTLAGGSAFNPYSESTQVKLSMLSISDIRAALGGEGLTGNEQLVLEVRVAATTKKPASRIATVTIPSQGEAPTARISYDGKIWTISELKAADKSAPEAFEYTIVKKSDISDNKLDMSTLKWFSAKNGVALKDSAKSTYMANDKSTRSVILSDADAQILVRRKGASGSAKSAAVLASKYLVLDILREAASATPTPSASGTPTATPEASGTPTPAPATPTATPEASGTPTPTPA